MVKFADYLDAHHSQLAHNKLALRAVKIAFHINANGIRDLFRTPPPNTDLEAVDRQIEKAAAEEPTYTNKLIASRFHQALTMLQRKGYMDLSGKLAYKDQEQR
jgi:hypothetical protein